MSVSESIQLGTVTFIGSHRGPLVRIYVDGTNPEHYQLVTQEQWQSLLAVADILRAIEPMRRVYEAALAYGRSEHTGDSNCSAGDCDSCSARPALNALEVVISEELARRRVEHGSWIAEEAASCSQPKENQ